MLSECHKMRNEIDKKIKLYLNSIYNSYILLDRIISQFKKSVKSTIV